LIRKIWNQKEHVFLDQ